MGKKNIIFNDFEETNEAILPLGLIVQEETHAEASKHFTEAAYYIAYLYDEVKVGKLAVIEGKLQSPDISYDNLGELRIFNSAMEFRAIRYDDSQFACRIAGGIKVDDKEIIMADYVYCEMHSVSGTSINPDEEYCVLSEDEKGVRIRLPIDSKKLAVKEYEPSKTRLVNLFIRTKNYIVKRTSQSLGDDKSWSLSLDCIDSRIEGFYIDNDNGWEVV